MPTIEFPGHTLDHRSLKLGFLNSTMVKQLVRRLRWDHGFERSKSYGTSPVPLTPNRGKYSGTASMDIYLEAWDDLLRNQLPDGYLELDPFPIIASIKSPGRPPYTLELVNCTLSRASGESAEENGAILITIPIDFQYAKENGKFPFKQVED